MQLEADLLIAGAIPDSPLVSVIVIGFNQQEFVPIAINSVLNQTYTNIECIFVDDGSQDATNERSAQIAKTEPRLEVYAKSNGGPGSARNFGAARISSKSEYIAFLDGDDVLHPDYIRVCLAYLVKNRNVGVVIPSHDFISASGSPLPNQRRGYRWVPSTLWLLPRRLRDFERATPFVTFYCGTGAVPFWFGRVVDYRKTEGWDEALWMVEDVDMLCQLAMITSVHTIEARLVDYRVHARQATANEPRTSRRQPLSADRVREKWNRRQYADKQMNRTLDLACLYYRQVHLPFRALWVARRAFDEFFRTPTLNKAAWFCKLLCFFLRDFLYFKILFWRSRRRYAATKFYEP